RRPETLDVGVPDEEPDGVPQREELALDLVCRAVAEQQVAVRRLVAVLPAHDVGAHACERFLGWNEIPPGAVHRPPVLVEHLLVAEDGPERRLVHQADRHEELRIEPQPNMLAHFGHTWGRYTRLT